LANDAEPSNPPVDIFSAALKKAAPIDATEALAIDDSPWDAIAAFNNMGAASPLCR
jgi:FMN phosphatase YigB (HAD superfamily)